MSERESGRAERPITACACFLLSYLLPRVRVHILLFTTCFKNKVCEDLRVIGRRRGERGRRDERGERGGRGKRGERRRDRGEAMAMASGEVEVEVEVMRDMRGASAHKGLVCTHTRASQVHGGVKR